MLEADEKSLRSLSGSTGGGCGGSRASSAGMHSSHHSRQSSASSILSQASISSSISGLQLEEDINDNPQELWEIWGKLVNDWENVVKKKPAYIKDLIRKGIPHHFRGIVWQLLCNAHVSASKEKYSEYLKMSSPCEKVIRRDITRTYPEHEFFKEKNGLGQESLFNVMKAYSLCDREVGYCQGSGFIVGLLLMQMPEEEAFAVFTKLMLDYRLRELFKPSMAELGLCMFQLECLVQDQMPDLYAHFQSHSLCVSMFASSWFLTLFTVSLPISIACRVFDLFLSEGIESIFRVGVAILYECKNSLLNMDMEQMLQFLQRLLPTRFELDPDALFNTAYSIKYNCRKMKKLEKEYNALKSKEQEDQVELRRLRTENKLLRQRIDNLEKETSTLADRLIQDQVVRAQKEEEVYSLRRDVLLLKQQNEDKASQIQELLCELSALREKVADESSNTSVESQQEERIQKLQRELDNSQESREESESTVKQLHSRIQELENVTVQLQRDPSDEMQLLQEELIACKMREAESSLAMRELRSTVIDLEKQWNQHFEIVSATRGATGGPQKSGSRSSKEQQIADELMAVRLREATAVGELKEAKQRIMELETQNQINSRQLKRMDDENNKLKEKIEENELKENDLKNQIASAQRKLSSFESDKQEKEMMSRIRDAEHSHSMAEMRQRIAELEIGNQELLTSGQLQNSSEKQQLESRISDLREEIVQLKMQRRLSSLSQMAYAHMGGSIGGTESDYDTDDMDTITGDASRFRLSDSTTASDVFFSSTNKPAHLTPVSSTPKSNISSSHNHLLDGSGSDADSLREEESTFTLDDNDSKADVITQRADSGYDETAQSNNAICYDTEPTHNDLNSDTAVTDCFRPATRLVDLNTSSTCSSQPVENIFKNNLFKIDECLADSEESPPMTSNQNSTQE